MNSYSMNILRINFSGQVSMSGQFIQINCAVVNDLEIWNTKNIVWEPNLYFSLLSGFFYKGFWRLSYRILLILSLCCQNFSKCCLPVESLFIKDILLLFRCHFITDFNIDSTLVYLICWLNLNLVCFILTYFVKRINNKWIIYFKRY